MLGVEPDAAYQFGFDSRLPVVDAAVFEEAWVLVSAGPPTTTLQIRWRGQALLFAGLPNSVHVLPGSDAESIR